jgi:hypothetical protein
VLFGKKGKSRKDHPIDHQGLSHGACVKFIEDGLLNNQRIDPKTDGHPDPRPVVRETAAQSRDLRQDFDFNQSSRTSLVLPVQSQPGPASKPKLGPSQTAER